MIEQDPLKTANALRVPVFERGTHPAEKAEPLEEFMLLSAFWQGECHTARVEAWEELAPLEDEWDTLEGWEPFRDGRTLKAVEDAKRILAPKLAERIRYLRRWIKLLSKEIERLDEDAKKVSRAYTILSGGT